MAENNSQQKQNTSPLDIANQVMGVLPTKRVGGQLTSLVLKRASLWLVGLLAGMGGFFVTFFFFLFLGLIVVAAVVVIFFLFGFGAGAGEFKAEASNPSGPGGGTGLGIVSNYCQIVDPTLVSCSGELEKIFEAAGAWAKVPAGVLVGIASIEGPQIFSYVDEQILLYSTAGGEDPYKNDSYDDNRIDNCNVSYAGAMGPMQFMPTTWDSGGDRYKEAVNIATGEGRSPDICNIKDAIYGAAWKLKCDSMATTDPVDECYSGKFTNYDYNDGTGAWERLEVDSAAGSYLGGGHCVDPASGYKYCDKVWEIYQAVSDYGSGGEAGGWPATGSISQGPYNEGGSHDPDDAYASSIDIDNSRGTPIFATQTGVLTYKDYGKDDELYVSINSTDGFGNGYIFYYVHLDAISECIRNTPLNSKVPEGELVGYMGDTGKTAKGHVHLHYMIRTARNENVPEEEFRSLLPVPNIAVGDSVTTNYSGVNCGP